jgi:hypothetical protein
VQFLHFASTFTVCLLRVKVQSRLTGNPFPPVNSLKTKGVPGWKSSFRMLSSFELGSSDRHHYKCPKIFLPPPPFGFIRDRVSLYSPGCPGTHFVHQAGLELRNLPASASQVLGLKACTTTPGYAPKILKITSLVVIVRCENTRQLVQASATIIFKVLAGNHGLLIFVTSVSFVFHLVFYSFLLPSVFLMETTAFKS